MLLSLSKGIRVTSRRKKETGKYVQGKYVRDKTKKTKGILKSGALFNKLKNNLQRGVLILNSRSDSTNS